MRLQQPSWPRMLPTWWVVNLATLGLIGRVLPAPGTWGSFFGVGYAAMLVQGLGLGNAVLLIVTVVTGYWAVGICGEAELRLGKVDPGEVILDEFVAMPLCFLGWSELTMTWPAWAVLLAGFALFRFFDILKPLGISQLQRLPAGWGVVIDDLAAALAACGVLHVVHALGMAH
jgi:phosphatidylglycerophosphatase A